MFRNKLLALNDAEVLNGQSVKGLLKQFSHLDKEVLETAETFAITGKGLDKVDEAMKKASSATSKFGATLKSVAANIGIMLAINVVINIATSLWDSYANRVENAREALEETTSEIESVESELKNVNKQIDEILAKDTIELTDEQDLKRLQLENTELSNRLKLLKAQKELEAQELNDAIEKDFKRDWYGRTTTVWEGTGEYRTDASGREYEVHTQVEHNRETGFYKRIEQLKEYASLERELTEQEKNDFESIRSYIIEEGQALSDLTEDYVPVTQAQHEMATKWEQMIADAASVADMYTGTAMDVTNRLYEKFASSDYMSSGKGKGTRTKNPDINLENANIETKNAIKDWIDGLDDNERTIMLKCELEDASLDELQAYLEEKTKEVGIDASISYSSLTEQYDSVSDSAKSLRSSITSLSKAFDEQNDSNSISVDTMLDLVEAGYATAISYDKATKSYVLNKDAVLALVRAKIEEQKFDIQKTQGELVNKLDEETDGLKRTTEGYYDLLEAKKLNLTTDQLLAMEQYNNLEAQRKALEDVYANWDNVVNGTSSSKVTDLAKDAQDAFSSIAKSFNDQMKSVDYSVSKIQRRIGEIEANDKIAGESFYNALIAQEETKIKQLTEKQAQLAESLNSSVSSGAISSGSEEWREMYNEILGVADAIDEANFAILEYKRNIKEIAKLNFDDLASQFENAMNIITHSMDMVDSRISNLESAGYIVSENYFKSLLEMEAQHTTTLSNEYNRLTSELSEALSSGAVEEYSDTWYEMVDSINGVEDALMDAESQVIEFGNAMRDVEWRLFDRFTDEVENFTSEADYLIEMLSGNDLYNDDGSLTDSGLAVQGLHAIKYNAYLEQAKAYADEIAEIESEMANDPSNTILIDRYNELLDLQHDMVLAAEDEKDAIKDLASEGFDSLISSLDSIIAKRKDAIRSIKDVYDYQKQIEEQSGEVSRIQKMILAYEGNDTAEIQSTLQKLHSDLADAKDALQETEYEQYIREQESMLDSFASEVELWANNRLDDINGLIQSAIDATNRNADTIANTIRAEMGMESVLSGSMNYLLQQMDAENAIVSEFVSHEMFGSGETSVSGLLESIRTETENLPQDIANGLNMESYLGGLGNMEGSLSTVASTLINISDFLNNRLQDIVNNSVAEAVQAEGHIQENVIENTEPIPVDIVGNSGSDSGSNTTTTLKPIVKPNNNNGMVDLQPREEEIGYTPTTRYEVYDIRTQEVIDTVDHDLTVRELNDYETWEINPAYLDVRKVRGYASGTANAKKGFNLVSEAGDEIILTKDGNALLANGAQLFPFQGGETVFNAEDTAELLKSKLVPLDVSALWGNMVKVPDYSSLVGSAKRGSGESAVTNEIHFDVSLNDTTDPNAFTKRLKDAIRTSEIEKTIQSMTTDQLAGRSVFTKYKF